MQRSKEPEMKELTFEAVDALATAKGFKMKEPSPGVFYLMFDDGTKAAINPKGSLPVFRGLKDVEKYLKSKASDRPTNSVRWSL